MYKGFKIRIYPTKKQEELFRKHIGAYRFIWNYMLDLQKERYANGDKYLSVFSMINLLTSLKHDGEHEWLSEVSRHTLSRTCQDLNIAYQRYFNKISGHPKFKSKKKPKQSYPVRSESFYFQNNKTLHIEKLGKVKYKTDIDFPIGNKYKFGNVRVLYEGNKWFIGLVMECENQAQKLTDKLMGIDLGIKELAVVAVDNEQFVFHNINKSQKVRKLEKK